MSSEVPPNIAIRVEGLSKRYRLGTRGYRRLGESIAGALRRPFGRAGRNDRDILWAVKGVSFDVAEGEILGIVGSNGAGKTTLLRVLSKITRPTEGRAEIYGRVGSLLEVGTGFHTELTGRENVFLNGAILGMTRREIVRKYDEIVAFAQIEEFMDTPVKHYSSGMRVRLAFSVAAHLEPEILFIDEVLAVGDAAFQQKCLGKMGEVAAAGRTVVFVSHNMGMITSLCSRAIWIDGGQIKMDGAPQPVVEAYLSRSYSTRGRWEHPPDADCGNDLRIQAVEVVDQNGTPRPEVPFDEPIRFRVEHEVFKALEAVSIGLRIIDVNGTTIFVTWNIDADRERTSWEPGRYRYACSVPAALLRPGKYFVTARAKTKGIGDLDAHVHCLGFEILPIRYTGGEDRTGVITPVLDWELESASRDIPIA
jgi:lipopolysaccharide transport system ATP-binding protein